MLELCASSIADTHAIAGGLAAVARVGDTIVLAGEMGAGKTAFAQGFGRALGIDEPITSPTFTLVHSYDLPTPVRGVRSLHHADLYRLDRTAEVADLALAELAEFGGVVLVEWGDVVEGVFGDHLVVHLAQNVDDTDTATDTDTDTDTGTDTGTGTGTAPDDDDDSDVLTLDGTRSIEVVGVGPSWAARWDRLVSGLEAFRC